MSGTLHAHTSLSLQHSTPACPTRTPHKFMLNEKMDKWITSSSLPQSTAVLWFLKNQEGPCPHWPQMGTRRKSPKGCFWPAVPFILFHVEVTLGHINSKQFLDETCFSHFIRIGGQRKGPGGAVWRTSKDSPSKQSVQTDFPRFTNALE